MLVKELGIKPDFQDGLSPKPRLLAVTVCLFLYILKTRTCTVPTKIKVSIIERSKIFPSPSFPAQILEMGPADSVSSETSFLALEKYQGTIFIVRCWSSWLVVAAQHTGRLLAVLPGPGDIRLHQLEAFCLCDCSIIDSPLSPLTYYILILRATSLKSILSVRKCEI